MNQNLNEFVHQTLKISFITQVTINNVYFYLCDYYKFLLLNEILL